MSYDILVRTARDGSTATERHEPRSHVEQPLPGQRASDLRSESLREAEPESKGTRVAGPGELYLCTWHFAESEADESTYPQVPGRPSSETFQSTYWRCVAAFFATSYRHQPQAKHLLFTNVAMLPSLSGVDMGALLEPLGVEVIRLPLTHVAPLGHFHAWRNQFYLFDIVSYLRRRIGERDAAIVLDSDCVWISDAGPIHEALDRDGVLTCIENYPLDWSANGLTREDMRIVASLLLGCDVPHPLVYCGGEFLAATGAELGRLDTEIAIAWQELLARYGQGERVFNEEAQLLSYVYYKLGYPLGNGTPYVRRIWTGSFGAFNTAMPLDFGLVVWHLPLEKRLGLRRLFKAVVDPTSQFWSVEPGREMRDYLGAILGVPHNSLRKKLRDLGRRTSDKLRLP